MHVNGWTIIERLLFKNKKNQSDLARKLKVSPAAVSQIKSGLVKMNSASFELVLNWLGATKDDKNALYTEVVNARLFPNGAKAEVIIK